MSYMAKKYIPIVNTTMSDSEWYSVLSKITLVSETYYQIFCMWAFSCQDSELEISHYKWPNYHNTVCRPIENR